MNRLVASPLAALAACMAAALLGCAHVPPSVSVAALLHDELFVPPAAPVSPAAALATSPAMRDYLTTRLAPARSPGADRRRLLVDALVHDRAGLRLEYDASTTRTAAEAFDARMGNCLALVLMTAAFARELGLPVRYQWVVDSTEWTRVGGLAVAVGHVNIALDPPAGTLAQGWRDTLIVDFIPSADAARLRTRTIDEATLIAMYLNNRAVESLAAGRADDAYWWARESARQAPELTAARLTLGVVYRARGRPDLAEPVLRQILEREPGDLDAMVNLEQVLRDVGRRDEADALAARHARLEAHPPFAAFEQGLAAYRDRRFEAARRLFIEELRRDPQHHESEFWLARTCAEQGDLTAARLHLARALASSTTRQDHALYAGKLERLDALTPP